MKKWLQTYNPHLDVFLLAITPRFCLCDKKMDVSIDGAVAVDSTVTHHVFSRQTWTVQSEYQEENAD